MTPFLRQLFLFLVALAALAIVLMMIATADAAELKQGSDGTRQIVVEESTQDKGAASTDLTAESGAVPAQTLASETLASEAPQPAAQTSPSPTRQRPSSPTARRSRLSISTRSI
jgi:hypothetical protein